MNNQEIVQKERFKMYKSGKQWLVAGLMSFALVGAVQIASNNSPIHFGQGIVAHAADSTTTYWMGQNTEYYKRYSDSPNSSTVPLSTQQGWGYASGEIRTLQNSATGTTFKFDSLNYDASTGLYTLTVKLNVPVLTTGGSGRTSYLDLGLSDSLTSKTVGKPSLIAANGNPGDLAQQANGTYSNSFSAGGYVGGTSTISIKVNPVKIQQNDEISAMYSSDTPTTGYHAIFSSVRTMGYNDFGLKFNQTLLAQMQKNSLQAVANATHLSAKQAQAATAAINNTTTDDDFVNKLQAIDKDVQAKNAANAIPIDQQRTAALAQYRKDHGADAQEAAIDADPTLTADQKAAQKQVIENAVNVIKTNLGKATDSDDVAATIADTSKDATIAGAHVPGTAIAQQISDAQAAMDKALADAQAAVDGQSNLTDTQKQAQKQALAAIAQTAKSAIGNATTADAINSALNAGKNNLAALNTAKQSAYSTLQAKANSAIATINNDPDLTDAQKQDRINQVNAALKAITDQIDPATDPAQVASLAANTTDLDKAIATATSTAGTTPIATQKANASANVDQTAADTKAKIDADNSLTDTEKTQEKANVDAAVTQAKTDIANGTAQTLATIVSKAQGTIAGQYVAGKPLPDRQKDAEQAVQTAADQAKANLDAQVAQANNDVDNNKYLTDAEKTAQKQAIQNAAQAAINKIDAATTADDVNTALANGQTSVSSLNQQKLDAHTGVNQKVKSAEDAINGNNALTAAEKASRIAQVESAKTAANSTIDNSIDPTEIANVPADGQTLDKALKAATDFSNVTPISDQQNAANSAVTQTGQAVKDAIDQAATAQENVIDQNGNLTPEQKAVQKAAVDNAVQAAKASINASTSADAINQAKQSALDNLNALSGAKTDARKSLATQAQNAIDTINNNPALTTADKAARVKQVTDALTTAGNAVDTATDVQGVTNAKNSTDFATAISNATDFSNVKSIADQQAAAKQAIDNAATDANATIDKQATAQENAIDANGALTPEQKAAQKQAVQNAATTAKNNIANASTADDINKALQTGTGVISSLSGAKTSAHEYLAAKAQNAINTINNNPALTDGDKANRIAQVNNAYATAISNVDQAQTVPDVTSAQNSADFTTALTKATDFSNVEPLANQKTDAANAIDAASAAAKTKVDADPSLSDTDKTAQKATIDTIASEYKSAINNAATATQVNDGKTAGLNAISAADKTTENATAAKRATDAHSAINNNAALTQAQKDAFNQQIDDAKSSVQTKLNASRDTTGADQLTNDSSSYATTLSGILNQASQVKSLADQQNDGYAALTKVMNDALTAIDNDKTLTDSDKQDQKDRLHYMFDDAVNAVKTAPDADSINRLVSYTTSDINDFSQAKTNGDATLADHYATAQTTINNNPALTAADKASRLAALKTAKDTAQNGVNMAKSSSIVPSFVSDFDKSAASITDFSNVKSIADQQADANKNIDSEIAAAKAKVDADPNLSDSDKAAQKASLDTLASQLKNNVSNAKTADDINSAAANATTAINNIDKTNADASIAKQVADAHSIVNNSTVLSDSDKAARNKAIDDAKTAAQDLVNKATTSDQVNAVTAQGSDFDKAIKAATDLTGIKSLADQKSDANAKIDQAAAAQKANIDKDPSLSDADKTAQKATIDQLAQTQKTTINAAQNSDDVNTATTNGVNAINVLDKTNADKQLSDKVAQAEATVNADPNLTKAQKIDRVNQIEAAKSNAQNLINQATTPDAINAALNSQELANAISNATSDNGVVTLADQKTTADKAIDDAANAQKSKIDADPNLSDTDKVAQKAVVDSAAAAQKVNVDNATNADDVAAASTNGVNTVNALDKTAANAAVTKRAGDAHTAINNNPALTQTQKDAYNKQINDAELTAQSKVNSANDVPTATSDVDDNSDYAKAVNAITAQANQTPTVAAQQTAADKAIDDAANAQKSKIDADPNLSDADKAVQKSVVDSVAANAKSAIQTAMNADDINKAQAAGTSSVNALDKTATNAALAKETVDAHASVNGNNALTQTEKDARNKAIDDATKTAQATVNSATAPDSAAAVIAQGGDYDKAIKSATDFSGVTSLDNQKSEAAAKIDASATAAKAKVDADPNLSDADKAAQKSTIDGLATQAKNAINGATNADDVIKSTQSGQQAIDNLDKTAADKSLADVVKTAHDSVNGNPALTQADKDKRNQEIDDAAKTAQAAINAATTTDAANAVTVSGSTFDNAVKAATNVDGIKSVAQQQADAAAKIDTVANTAKSKIDADPNLSDADKAAQKSVIDGLDKQAKDAINAATTADDITKAETNGQAPIDGLDKTTANKTLADAVKNAHDAINNNPALSDAEKSARNKAIDDAAAVAKNAINNATTTDAANAVTVPGSTFDNAIKAATDTTNVKSIAQQQSDAAAKIDAAANAAKTKIDNDKNLSDADKSTQKSVIDNLAKQAKDAINAATTADGITNAETSGQAPIDNLDKTTADQAVADKIAQAHSTINNNPALSQAEKDARNKAIDDAVKVVQGLINGATTPDAVNAAIAQSGTFDNAVKAATDTSNVKTIAQQQSDAAAKIDAAATAQKAKIDADKNLSDADKTAQKSVIDDLATKAKNDINAATTADDIAKAETSGQASIDNLDKTTADQDVADKIAQAHSAINNNPALTQDEKAARNSAIDSAAKSVQDLINKATTPDEVNAAVAQAGTFDKAINDATNVDGVKSIAQQQADADSKIDDAATAAKAKIDADPNLSDADTTAQKAVIDGLATDAKSNINNAKTADDINKALTDGQLSINNLDKTPVDQDLANKIKNAHSAVNANPALTQVEKDARNKQIDDAAKTAQDSVNKAKTLADAQAAINTNSDFDKAVSGATDTTNVKTIAQQQADADAKIDDALKAAQAKVDADKTLTDDDKAAQKQVLQNIADGAKSAINSATNADDINKATQSGQNALAKLSDAKVSADQAVADKVKTTEDAINTNPVFSTSEKQSRIAAVEAAKKTAQDAINKATTPDAVNAITVAGGPLDQATSTGTSTTGVPSLADQKSSAVAALNDTATQAKAKIDADPNISDADKAAQKAVIDANAKDAADAINAATNADDITKAQTDGIDGLHNLTNAKTAADASLANQVKNAEATINANNALSGAEKQSRLDALHKAASDAQTLINNAKSPDTVNATIAQGSDFDNAVKTATNFDGVESLDNQKNDAKSAIDNALKTAQTKVDADKTLSDSDKADQKQVLQDLADKIKSTIDAANDSDAVTAAKNAGIDELVKLTDAKTATDQALADKIANAEKSINDNNALSSQQKQDRLNALHDAAKTAQDAINKATTPDAVNAVIANGGDLDNAVKNATDYSNVPSLDDQKNTAKSSIDQAQKNADTIIDADDALTDAEKQAEKDAIAKLAEQAKSAIDAATDSDSVAKTADDAVKTINELHDTKANVIAGLQKQADDLKAKINANPALTADQKKSLTDSIDAATTDARKNTAGTGTPDDATKSANQDPFNKALNDAQKVIDSTPSIADQQAAAKSKIAEAVNAAKNALSGDNANAQQDALDKIKSAIDDAIDKGADADTINKIVADKTAEVNATNGHKADVLKSVTDRANAAIDTINKDINLTDAQKAQRISDVKSALQDVTNDINNATTPDAIDAAKNSQPYTDKLNAATSDQGVQTLADRKTEAVKNLQDQADKIKTAIDADKTLSDSDKAAQKAAIDEAVKTETDKINAALDATATDNASDSAIKTINALNDAKIAARQAADKAYQDAVNKIDGNKDLTDAEKQARKSALDTAYTAAKDAINKATTVDGLNNADGVKNFPVAVTTATDFSKVPSLADQKKAAADKINDALNKAIDEVNNDPKLDSAAKSRQIAILNKQGQDAIDTLNGQPDAQHVVDFVPTVVPTFENLNKAKSDARAKLQDQAAKAKEQIDADKTLSTDEKSKAKQAVDDALNKAEINVDNGTDIPTITKIPVDPIVVTGLSHKAEKTLEELKQEAIASINKQGQVLKDKVNADSSLSATQKAAKLAAIDKAVADAIAKVNAATDADEINDAVKVADTNIQTGYETKVEEPKTEKPQTRVDKFDPVLPKTGAKNQNNNVAAEAGLIGLLATGLAFMSRKRKEEK